MRDCVLDSYKATGYPFSLSPSQCIYAQLLLKMLFSANFTMQDLWKNANLRLDVRKKQSHAIIRCCIIQNLCIYTFFFLNSI